MFSLPDDFDKDGEMSFLALSEEGSEESAVMIGEELIGGWTKLGDTVYLRETTYKHYKFYTDGAAIDLIQKLAHHNKATFDAGTDLDGDIYWEVSFKIDDFCRKYVQKLLPKQICLYERRTRGGRDQRCSLRIGHDGEHVHSPSHSHLKASKELREQK